MGHSVTLIRGDGIGPEIIVKACNALAPRIAAGDLSVQTAPTVCMHCADPVHSPQSPRAMRPFV